MRVQLTALIAAFGVLAGGAAFYQRDSSIDDAEQRTTQAVSFRAQLAAHDIGRSIQAASKAMTDVAANPALEKLFGPTIPPGCTLAFGGEDSFTHGHIDVVSSAGSVRCSSGRLPRTAYYADAAWLRHTRRGPVVAGPLLDPATGHQSLVVAAPIVGLGAVVTFLDLTGAAGRLADRLSGPVDTSFSLGDAPGAGTFSADAIAATAAIPGLNLSVQASTSRDEAIADELALSNRLLEYLGVVIVILLLAVELLYVGLARPIRRLSAIVRSVTPGELPAGLPTTGHRRSYRSVRTSPRSPRRSGPSSCSANARRRLTSSPSTNATRTQPCCRSSSRPATR